MNRCETLSWVSVLSYSKHNCGYKFAKYEHLNLPSFHWVFLFLRRIYSLLTAFKLLVYRPMLCLLFCSSGHLSVFSVCSKEAEISTGCLAILGSLWTSVHSSDHLLPSPTHKVPQRQISPGFLQMVDVHSLNVSNLFSLIFILMKAYSFVPRWKQGLEIPRLPGC